MKTVVLAILDGWGLGKKNDTNPIYVAKPETIEYIEKYYPAGSLNASGISVGLPWGEEGNSEVGHLTIGAGRVLYQHFLRITKSIENGDFFDNETLKNAFDHSKNNNSTIHLVGLLTEGKVHASIDHIKALLKMAKQQKAEEVSLHLFADGKDSSPKSIKPLLEKLRKFIKEYDVGTISSISGRYYAMDREERWNRTQQAYQALTGNAPKKEIESAINETYKDDLTDEYIEPFITPNAKPIKNSDSVLFFNFREDSIRQIVASFIFDDFSEFETEKIDNTLITTLTEYNENFDVPVVFPKKEIKNTLGEVIANNNKTQLRIAETEKGAHVTYFFNGLKSGAFNNEFRILIPSLNVNKIEEQPKMQAKAITERVILSMQDGSFNFILVNYANPDVIAHTGNYNSAIEAIKTIDKEINKLLREAINGDHTLLITSDHGNSESLFDPTTGQSETKHNVSPVPFYVIDKNYQGSSLGSPGNLPKIGILADVAPTVLDLMGIQKPKEMTGNSLIDIL